MDYFIGFTMADKLALLLGIQKSMLTGQVVEVETGRNQRTRFDPKISNELTYQRLCDSIAGDENFDSTDPIQAGCAANGRVASTRVSHNCD